MLRALRNIDCLNASYCKNRENGAGNTESAVQSTPKYHALIEANTWFG